MFLVLKHARIRRSKNQSSPILQILAAFPFFAIFPVTSIPPIHAIFKILTLRLFVPAPNAPSPKLQITARASTRRCVFPSAPQIDIYLVCQVEAIAEIFIFYILRNPKRSLFTLWVNSAIAFVGVVDTRHVVVVVQNTATIECGIIVRHTWHRILNDVVLFVAAECAAFLWLEILGPDHRGCDLVAGRVVGCAQRGHQFAVLAHGVGLRSRVLFGLVHVLAGLGLAQPVRKLPDVVINLPDQIFATVSGLRFAVEQNLRIH